MDHIGLERRLPIALQFVTFSSDQRAVLKKASDIPAHIESMMHAFHHGLAAEEQVDPNFAYRVAFVPKLGSRASSSDLAVEFIKADSEEAREVSRVLLKEVDKRRYSSKQVVEKVTQRSSTRTIPISGKALMQKTQQRISAARAIIRACGFGMMPGSLAFGRIAKSKAIDTGKPAAQGPRS